MTFEFRDSREGWDMYTPTPEYLAEYNEWLDEFESDLMEDDLAEDY